MQCFAQGFTDLFSKSHESYTNDACVGKFFGQVDILQGNNCHDQTINEIKFGIVFFSVAERYQKTTK